MPRLSSNSRPMQASISHMSTDRPEFKLIGSVGFWLAVAMSALQGLNAVRTFFDPVGFASYMGVPINGTEQVAWVQIYGLRAAFISLLVAVLIIRQDMAALKWTAITALVMPLGDAWLASQAGAPPSIVGRHMVIAVFLILASYFLGRVARQQAQAGGDE